MAAGGGGSAKALDTRDVRHKKLTPDQQSYTYEDLGDGGTELFKAHSPELYQQLMSVLALSGSIGSGKAVTSMQELVASKRQPDPITFNDFAALFVLIGCPAILYPATKIKPKQQPETETAATGSGGSGSASDTDTEPVPASDEMCRVLAAAFDSTRIAVFRTLALTLSAASSNSNSNSNSNSKHSATLIVKIRNEMNRLRCVLWQHSTARARHLFIRLHSIQAIGQLTATTEVKDSKSNGLNDSKSAAVVTTVVAAGLAPPKVVTPETAAAPKVDLVRVRALAEAYANRVHQHHETWNEEATKSQREECAFKLEDGGNASSVISVLQHSEQCVLVKAHKYQISGVARAWTILSRLIARSILFASGKEGSGGGGSGGGGASIAIAGLNNQSATVLHVVRSAIDGLHRVEQTKFLSL